MPRPIEKQPESGERPIRFFLTPEMLPDAETLAQLQTLAATPGLDHYVAVLPDIHRKSRNLSPTGTVVASKNVLVPRAVDTGICCGMRMIRSNLEVRALTPAVLDELFNELRRTIPVFEHDSDVLTREELADLLVQGGAWSQKRYGLSAEEMSCIEDHGTLATDTTAAEKILACLPRQALKKGRRCYGTLGDGNHFLELQEIVEVLEPETARRLGLAPGQALFMLHTGSRSVGSKTMKGYLESWEEDASFMQAMTRGTPIWSMPAEAEIAQEYLRAIAAASNFGFANRIAITERLRAAVRRVLRDESLALPLLYDCAHVSIKREQWRGEALWVHRHGASRALPASRLSDHPLFRLTGQPLPIPGSMGHASFVGVALEGAGETFYSVNHGAGRVLDKPEAVAAFTEQLVTAELQNKNIRLYRYGEGNLAEQAPASFKDVSQVVAAMTALNLARPVVRLRPVAVLKG
ncbi:MAG: RtcB family protein [candidate division KSB1 bacterium]|nr:RtcB family protein [candidate division KSB1 bacterium]MDZ7273242.1 RtcB family protein [candidate division KSB1 bacterium]MDZ7285344.1 RtcB family protein [candidate division KSB1 bacterium]MDZ7298376.1 RtcB family protein [candidate division KSB1 bacterium]MDZ7348991.1 RtcB family protein [candidate division KSB1 bacterium]